MNTKICDLRPKDFPLEKKFLFTIAKYRQQNVRNNTQCRLKSDNTIIDEEKKASETRISWKGNYTHVFYFRSSAFNPVESCFEKGRKRLDSAERTKENKDVAFFPALIDNVA